MILVVLATVATTNATSGPEGWRCRNTVEVQCHAGQCAALPHDETTPLDVAFSNTGSFMVCAYTGCWEGGGDVHATEPFLVITQDSAPWSDPYNPDNARNIAIIYDRTDNTAIVKAGVFVIPLACEPLKLLDAQ